MGVSMHSCLGYSNGTVPILCCFDPWLLLLFLLWRQLYRRCHVAIIRYGCSICSQKNGRSDLRGEEEDHPNLTTRVEKEEEETFQQITFFNLFNWFPICTASRAQWMDFPPAEPVSEWVNELWVLKFRWNIFRMYRCHFNFPRLWFAFRCRRVKRGCFCGSNRFCTSVTSLTSGWF